MFSKLHTWKLQIARISSSNVALMSRCVETLPSSVTVKIADGNKKGMVSISLTATATAIELQ